MPIPVARAEPRATTNANNDSNRIGTHDGTNQEAVMAKALSCQRARLDRRVLAGSQLTMHDCGTILHPAMVDGQVRGGFAQALGAALYEEYA
jgi:hypothetical protein